MKVPVYSLDGKELKEVSLPQQFDEEYREDLIRRAVLSEESKERQPKGTYVFAGLETSADYRGVKDTYGSLKNRGQAMLPREIRPKGNWGRVRRIPSSVKGRRAHPPKVGKKIFEKINKKEYQKALRSALSASANLEIVSKRADIKKRKLPIIIENDFEKIKKSKEVLSVLQKLEIGKLVEEAKEKTRVKTGVRKRMKQRTKTPRYLLIVTSENAKSGRNLSGIDMVKVSELKVKHLSPGAFASRVVMFTENALKEIGERL
ncbi:MAG: uL4 family ribosomal protein [Candidatus ainarchaeum sp.]|nr:uL4 family ribosomal protein [Candidatus ainarchaeum sp.]